MNRWPTNPSRSAAEQITGVAPRVVGDPRGLADGHARHRDALAVMARRPVAGRVKTRLAVTLGDEAAAARYGALVDDTLRRASRLRGVALYLALAPEAADEESAAEDATPGLSPPAATASDSSGAASEQEWHLLPQEGSGLGERLSGVFARLFDFGHENVVIIGSDSPCLPIAFIERALTLLRTPAGDGPADAVVGPTFDGGYYLIALSRQPWHSRERDLRDLLGCSPMGTPQVAAHTLSGLERLGIRAAVLPAWVDVDTPPDVALAAGLEPGATRRDGPQGRLRGVYLHVTHRCDTGCPQCYLQDARIDGGGGQRELTTHEWRGIIDQAVSLGATGFVFIGGDPFQRPDLIDLIDHVTGAHAASARLFFNRPVDPAMAARLARVGRGRLVPLVSVDGPAEVNDALRGEGNLDSVVASVRALLGAGLRPIANTVLLRPVLPGLPSLIRLLADEGVTTIHLILPHRRGGLARAPEMVPTGEELLEAFERTVATAEEVGVAIDNLSAWKSRLRSPRDLCGAGCSMLAVDPDGLVHACPITCGDAAFVAGDVRTEPLEAVWRRSPSLDLLRAAHARDRDGCRDCAVVDACGGECWVQAHYAAVADGRRAGYLAPFPYCGLVRPVLERLVAAEGREDHVPTDGQVDLTPFDCI